MPLYDRLTRFEDRYWKVETVEHLVGEKRLSKGGNVYILLETAKLFSIDSRICYIVLDEEGNKYTINPEAWDLMKEL